MESMQEQEDIWHNAVGQALQARGDACGYPPQEGDTVTVDRQALEEMYRQTMQSIDGDANKREADEQVGPTDVKRAKSSSEGGLDLLSALRARSVSIH